MEEQGYYIADDCNPLDDIIKSERYKELMDAIEKLQPQQKVPIKYLTLLGYREEKNKLHIIVMSA